MRHIAPALLIDSFVGRLTYECKWFWLGLLLRVDDQGRMPDDAEEIRAAIFPHDPMITADVVDHWLKMLAKERKIIRYAAGNNGSGRRLIQIRKWWTYQSGAQGMKLSEHSAPPGWIDRVRQHWGHDWLLINWDKEGGLRSEGGGKTRQRTKPAPTQVLRRSTAGPAKAQEESEIESEIESESEKERAQPPYPPSNQGGRKAAGRQAAQSNNHEDLMQLRPDERHDAEAITKILNAASFRDKRKTASLSVEVATRSFSGDRITGLVIPAFAAAHADERVKDPVAVAVKRLEDKQHNRAFEDPKTWRSVPVAILQAAGIDNLSEYQIKRFTRGGAQ